MSAAPSPVATLFPPDRVKRCVVTTSRNRSGAHMHVRITVIGPDNDERLVERSRTLTGVEYQAAVRRGAVPALSA